MKRVIVTGASGFIGRYTLPMLVQSGFEVHAVSRHPDPEPCEGVFWHHLDIMDEQGVDALCSNVQATHLLHLAWYTEHGKFWHADENLDWVVCSLRLLKHFVHHGGQRVLMAGSCAEYDWHGVGLCSENQTPCVPATLYGVSKHALYQVAAAYSARHQVELAWGRVFFLYGPGETGGRFVPSVVNGLLRQETVPCSGGMHVRDFMHVADVAAAFVALLASEMSGAVNIASGESHTLREIGEEMMRQIKGRGAVVFGALPDRQDDPAVLTADVAHLRDGVGWRPVYSLEQGLAETIAWWKQNREGYDAS
jgi:nucleoside-diphosphate-sugar epimerase